MALGMTPFARTASKGRPAARLSSPCPQREAVRERGEGAQRHRGVSHHFSCLGSAQMATPMITGIASSSGT